MRTPVARSTAHATGIGGVAFGTNLASWGQVALCSQTDIAAWACVRVWTGMHEERAATLDVKDHEAREGADVRASMTPNLVGCLWGNLVTRQASIIWVGGLVAVSNIVTNTEDKSRRIYRTHSAVLHHDEHACVIFTAPINAAESLDHSGRGIRNIVVKRYCKDPSIGSPDHPMLKIECQSAAMF